MRHRRTDTRHALRFLQQTFFPMWQVVLSLACCLFIPLGYALYYDDATIGQILVVAATVAAVALFFHVLGGIQRVLNVDGDGPSVDVD